MGCYICAYKRSETPESKDKLPEDSANTDLGTCSLCAVWACASHGTRYQEFECAICTPASAIVSAVTAGSTGNAAAGAAWAYCIHTGIPDAVLNTVRNALAAIVGDARAFERDRRMWVGSDQGSPNLVANLSEAIRASVATEIEGAPLRLTIGDVSIDAIGGAVREKFLDRQLDEKFLDRQLDEKFLDRQLDETDEAVRIVAGAMQFAYELADEQHIVSRRLPWRAPWEVAEPMLLDPVVWMLGTAYVRQPN